MPQFYEHVFCPRQFENVHVPPQAVRQVFRFLLKGAQEQDGVGPFVGNFVGAGVGRLVGAGVGLFVGVGVGLLVGLGIG